jgi:hypothetical protein
MSAMLEFRSGGRRVSQNEFFENLQNEAIEAGMKQLEQRVHDAAASRELLCRVAKERIIEAVHEGVTEAAAKNIAAMKKQPMAETAAKLLAGKGWLPALLRLGANASA